jgi:hypothetical protein
MILVRPEREGVGCRVCHAVPSANRLLAAYEVQTASGSAHWNISILAQDWDAFNAAIVGPTEVVAAFGQTEGDR